MNHPDSKRAPFGELAVGALVFFAAFWILAGPADAKASRGAIWCGLFAAEILLIPAVIHAAGALLRGGMPAFGAAVLGALYGAILAVSAIHAGGYGAPDTLLPLLGGALPMMALLTAVFWLAERAGTGARLHGLLALTASLIVLTLPFLLDRYFSAMNDFGAAYERRAGAMRLALPLATAESLRFDLLRAPKLYVAFRLGEGSFSYPAAKETAMALAIVAGVTLGVFVLLPAFLFGRRRETPGF